MRYGCCVNMEAQDAWGVGFERLDSIKRLGFDYVELPLAQMMQMPRDAFEEQILGELQRTGTSCEACNNLFPATLRLTGPEVDPGAVEAYAAQAVALAAELGVRILVFGSSGARNVPDGFPKHTAYVQLANTLSLIAPMAAAHGIRIAMEPLNRMESNILNSYQSGQYLAALSGQPNVGSLVDFYHFTVGGESLDDLLICPPEHVHFAQALGRLLPRTNDSTAYPPFFAALRQAGYDARVSLEGYTQGDYVSHLEQSLSLLRTL